VNIRKAAESDVPVIVDYNLRLAKETEELTLGRATLKAGVEAMFREGDKGVYYVAELDGKVIGQVMITYEWSDWRNGNIWWLQSVYVHPTYRRRGVFAALFAHVQQLCAAEGGSALRLYMHADNARARLCYSRLGMVETKYQVFEKSPL
jgi:GNAT superfamily N-acetyltransferase